jgi:membrane protease YdiL (CAAX protease family)
MAEKTSFIKIITGASFLGALVVILLFMLAYTSQPSFIFPKDIELWRVYLLIYVVVFSTTLGAITLIAPEYARNLAKANYWKNFVIKFIPTFIVSTIIFVAINFIFRRASSVNVFTAISYMNWSVFLVYLLVVAQVEEILFGGLIYTAVEKQFANKKQGTKAAYIATTILFALWHLAKTGGNLVLLIVYIPLRIIFNYTRNNGIPGLARLWPAVFGPSPTTQQTNAAVHASWNVFVTSFVSSVRV